jgi:hypothetical protein
MTLSEAVNLLGKWSREELLTVLREGVALPSSGKIVRINATKVGRDYDISESSLDAFISAFEKEEPGRWPPTAVRRELLVEAGHRCAICEDSAPLQYHHIVEFNRVRHYDTRHMLAICGTCHHKCTIGIIDRPSQRAYKQKLSQLSAGPMYLTVDGPARFSWDDLRDVVDALHTTLRVTNESGNSRYDFTDVDLDEKNILNNLDEEYFEEMRHADEPYFGRIRQFLENPANSEIVDQYYDIVDELRRKIVTDRKMFGGFEQVLTRFADVAVQNTSDGLRGKRRALRIMLSFMYFNCDIGRKV